MTTWIVVPAYNSARFLAETIASVRSQTVETWRAIVVDDGSSDETTSITERAQREDRRFCLISQPNGGVAAARNRGRQEALSDPECDSVLFLDADDVMRPTSLATLRAALRANPSAPAVHGLASFIDARGQPMRPGRLEAWCRLRCVPRGIGLRTLNPADPSTFESLVCVHGVPTPGVALIDRWATEVAGGFDTAINETSDWEMWVRLGHFGDLPRVDEVVLDYRVHEDNMSGDTKRMARAAERAWRRIWDSELNTAAERQAIRRGYRNWHLFMASRKPAGALSALARKDAKASARELAYGLNHVRRAAKFNPGDRVPGPRWSC